MLRSRTNVRLGIKGKQVLGVTAIVGVVVVALSLLQLARLAQVNLQESQARAELLANAVYHRAREVVADGVDPVAALRADDTLALSKGTAIRCLAIYGGVGYGPQVDALQQGWEVIVATPGLF